MALRSLAASPLLFPAGAGAGTGWPPACRESSEEAAGFAIGTTGSGAGAAQAVGIEGTVGMGLFVGLCPSAKNGVEVRWAGELEVRVAAWVGDAETKSAKSNSPRVLLSVLGVFCACITHGELTAL